MTCPNCDYERRPDDRASAGECPRCGVVFAKFHARVDELGAGPAAVAAPWPAPAAAAPPDGPARRALAALLAVKPSVGPLEWWGHALVYAVFFAWGWYFILADYKDGALAGSFMHNVDLPFHEAGHVLFRPFGDFMTVLGGSLGQVLVPLVVVIAFLRKRDNFGAAVGVWWLGQNFVDLAPYIYDASRLVLPLLGGVTGADVPGYHDWNNILRRLGMLTSDWLIAKWSDRVGVLLLLAFMAWGGVLLAREYRNLDRDA